MKACGWQKQVNMKACAAKTSSSKTCLLQKLVNMKASVAKTSSCEGLKQVNVKCEGMLMAKTS